MDREGKIGAGFEPVQFLLEKQRVGAEIDEFLTSGDTRDDVADLGMNERLAAGDRNDGGTALVDRFEAFVDTEAEIEDMFWKLNLTADGAFEIAAEQRLQHQHQRVSLHARNVLLQDVGADSCLLDERNSQGACTPVVRISLFADRVTDKVDRHFEMHPFVHTVKLLDLDFS